MKKPTKRAKRLAGQIRSFAINGIEFDVKGSGASGFIYDPSPWIKTFFCPSCWAPRGIPIDNEWPQEQEGLFAYGKGSYKCRECGTAFCAIRYEGVYATVLIKD